MKAEQEDLTSRSHRIHASTCTTVDTQHVLSLLDANSSSFLSLPIRKRMLHELPGLPALKPVTWNYHVFSGINIHQMPAITLLT